MAGSYALGNMPLDKVRKLVAKMEEFLAFIRDENMTSHPLVRSVEGPMLGALNMFKAIVHTAEIEAKYRARGECKHGLGTGPNPCLYCADEAGTLPF